jgi:hypothetical protein
MTGPGGSARAYTGSGPEALQNMSPASAWLPVRAGSPGWVVCLGGAPVRHCLSGRVINGGVSPAA